MMNAKKENHIIDLLFTLTLFGVFAASALLVVIFGARIYQNTAERMNQSFTSRTAVSYVVEKIHQRDVVGAVGITEVEGTPAVTLIRQFDKQYIRTYIYSDDGYLKELNVTGEAKPTKAAGQKIMELSDFSVSQIGEGIYYFTVTDVNNNHETAYFSSKCNPEIGGGAIASPGIEEPGAAMEGPAMEGPAMEAPAMAAPEE